MDGDRLIDKGFVGNVHGSDNEGTDSYKFSLLFVGSTGCVTTLR
jgi:hypothetical protein